MKRRASTPIYKNAPYKAPRTKKQISFINPPVPRMGIKPEKKNVDVTTNVVLGLTSGASGSWSAPVLLNGIPLGAGTSARVGRNASLKSMQLRIAHAQNGAQTMQLRILVVYDRNPNATNAIAGQILQSPSSTESPLNLGTTKRFSVIIDKITNIDGANAQIVLDEPHFRKLNLPMEFSGDTGDILSLTTGAIWMLFSCNVIAAQGPQVNYYSRIRYTDI